MNKLIKITLLMASILSFTAMANDAALGPTPTDCTSGSNISMTAAATLDKTPPAEDSTEGGTPAATDKAAAEGGRQTGNQL